MVGEPLGWRPTMLEVTIRRGDKYVTVIIDLTPIRNGSGPARLLDMIEGRSKQVFKTWLAERPQAWRKGVEVVGVDGFAGYKSATVKEHVPVEATWSIYQRMITAYRDLDRARGKAMMKDLIASISRGVTAGLK